MTVEEHLWFFAKLKGCPSRKVDAEVWKMINAVGLMDKKDTQARALSGGMKRKLSVGIALIADSKVNDCFIGSRIVSSPRNYALYLHDSKTTYSRY